MIIKPNKGEETMNLAKGIKLNNGNRESMLRLSTKDWFYQNVINKVSDLLVYSVEIFYKKFKEFL